MAVPVSTIISAVYALDERIDDVRLEENTAPGRLVIRVVVSQMGSSNKRAWARAIQEQVRELLPAGVAVAVEVHSRDPEADDLAYRVRVKVKALWGDLEREFWHGEGSMDGSPRAYLGLKKRRKRVGV